MTHKERFLATIHYEKTDRPATWLGLPVPKAEDGLKNYFRVSSMDHLKVLLYDDIYPIKVPYHFPPSNKISCALNFAKKESSGKVDELTLTVPCFIEDYSDPSDVERFKWPDPADYIDRDLAKEQVISVDPSYAKMGILWSAHFQDACAAFGMEKALITMMVNPEMFTAVIDRIIIFYLRANEIFLESTKGFMDAVLIGNDFGSQTALMVGPEQLRRFIFPGTRKFIKQAKSYDLKVMHHSCGSIFPIIDDLIGIGTDIIHPIQALANDMDAKNLKDHYHGKIAFCGGVDAQNLLVNGTPQNVRRK